MQTFESELDKIEEDNVRSDLGTEADEINLAESLKDHQDYPIILRPHTLTGWFFLVDGHRRCRAARRAGLKTLKAVLVDGKLSPSEVRLIQLRTDIHKKKLTPYELSMILIGLEKERPGTVKQLSALVNMEETLVWKYLTSKKLSPASMQAFKDGKIGLKDVVELAKLGHDEQPVLLNLRLGGASTEEVRKARKKSTEPAVRSSAIKCPLPSGQVVTVKGEEISLEEAIESLSEAVKLMKAALAKGLNAKTAMSVWKDVAAAG